MEKYQSQESQETKEAAQAIQHNLRMLHEDMFKIASEESIGGNAGEMEIDGEFYPCLAANGYMNPKTGEIVCFGNYQNISEEVRAHNAPFTIRIAMDTKTFRYVKAEIVQSENRGSLTDQAMSHLASAVKLWNEEIAVMPGLKP